MRCPGMALEAELTWDTRTRERTHDALWSTMTDAGRRGASVAAPTILEARPWRTWLDPLLGRRAAGLGVATASGQTLAAAIWSAVGAS
jgi:hypothetical protein